MKSYIEFKLCNYKRLYPNVQSVVANLFSVLGNGEELDNKGYLYNNYSGEECYDFPEPAALSYIYPWSKNEKFQPFRDLAGCRDVGFKETAQYFIDCVKITPDTVSNIKDWKDNIHIVEEVLLNTETIKDEYDDVLTGYSKFKQKLKNNGSVEEPSKSVSKQWFFDVQWSDCPEFVTHEVRHLWTAYELGNDNYIVKLKLDNELFQTYPNIYFWLQHNGVQLNDRVIVHWWW